MPALLVHSSYVCFFFDHDTVKGKCFFGGGVLISVLTFVLGLFPLLIKTFHFPDCLLGPESAICWTFLNSSLFILLTQLALFP